MLLSFLKGKIRYFFYPTISIASLIDSKSNINRNSKINRFVKIVNSSIGKYSYIAPNSWIVNTEIGSFCSIAANVNIGLESHTINNISTSPIFTEKNNATGKSWINKDTFKSSSRTIIGSDVWIGHGALIKAGIIIGDGAIIGAGAVVTKNVLPYSIVGGIPAKFIRKRFNEEIIDQLIKLKWWNLSDDILKNNIEIFQKENFTINDLTKISKC